MMKNRLRRWAAGIPSSLGLFAAGLFAAGLSTSADAARAARSVQPQAVSVAPLPAPYSQWIQALSSAGYQVQQGTGYYYGPTDCEIYVQIFGSCAANNPATPYAVIQPPIEAGQYIDPYYGTKPGVNAFTKPGPQGDVNELYRASDNEAVVVVMSLPPKAAYLGYQSYMFSRVTTDYPNLPTRVQNSPDPNRINVLGSLGNAINNGTLNKGAGLTPSQGAWGGYAVFVTTSNANIDAAIRNVYRTSTGRSDNSIFTEPLGTDINTGLGADADDLYTLIRYTIPQDAQASATWLNDIGNHLWVYRVINPSIPVARFPKPVLTTKVANPEAQYQSSLDELTTILSSWLRVREALPIDVKQAPASVTVDSNGNNPTGTVGPECIEKGTYCVADTQDTESYRFADIGKLTGTHTVVVIGPNNATCTTDNTYYESFGVYDARTVTGIASLSQANPCADAAGFSTGVLTGSAAQALQELGLTNKASAQLLANLPNLYVTFVSRQCDPTLPNCLQITTQQVPLSGAMLVSQRSYLKPSSTTGANPNLLLSPNVLIPQVPNGGRRPRHRRG